MFRRAAIFLCLLLGGLALAQESAHFKVKGPVLNGGGDPQGGMDPSSASYKLRPDALDEAAAASSLSSVAFRMGGGFVLSFPRPGEINNLAFSDSVTLTWNADPFAAHYHLYRTPEMGPGMGVSPSADCLQPDVPSASTTDAGAPSLGRAYFYGATAVNCIRLEGPHGSLGARCE